jgi:hypothetical protein
VSQPTAAEKLSAEAATLYGQWADAQAAADQILAKLNKLKAKINGDPMPDTGLDLLWQAAPPMARTRSSKYKCRVAWNRIPAAHRPRVPVMLDALAAWKRCDEWQKDDGQFIPALDRWIRERRWEDLPETARVDPSARYRCQAPAPLPQTPPEERATPEEIKAMFEAVNSALGGKFPSNR